MQCENEQFQKESIYQTVEALLRAMKELKEVNSPQIFICEELIDKELLQEIGAEK